jgi:dipeptidyl aminopeptidase/acylaminoacyl peptidase
VPEQVLAYSGFAVLCANANHDAIAQTGQNGRPLYFAGHRAAAESYDGFVSVLSERGLVDRTKVGVSGFSYGAGILGWALIHSKSYAAAALSTVPYNPFLYYMQYRPETFFGLPRLDRDPENRWGEVAMALSPERVRVPILAQTNVNTAKAMADMANVFSRDKKPLEIIVYTDEGHHKWQPLHRRLVYERYVDWFRYWLQGHVSPDSTKRTQYIRWERLRAMQERTYNEN